jgi:hypothetical protein
VSGEPPRLATVSAAAGVRLLVITGAGRPFRAGFQSAS